MKFYQLIALFSLFFHLSSNAQSFRASEWGMSMQDIKETESAEIIKESESMLIYSGTFAEKFVLVLYDFEQNKLVKGRYLIAEPYSEKNDYILAYNDMKELLQQDFGTPYENNKHWISKLYKDMEPDWGESVAAGHLSCYSSWKKDDADILLYMITGKLQDIDIIIEYSSEGFLKSSEGPSVKEALEIFSSGGIRKSPWGMSLQQVKDTETEFLFLENVDKLGYFTKVNNLSMIVGYDFIDNALESGKFILNETHENKNDYINDFFIINGYLGRIYGSPESDEVWSNDLYRDDYSEWGKAIGVGHLYMYAIYMNRMTSVQILLEGKDDEIKLSVYIEKRD